MNKIIIIGIFTLMIVAKDVFKSYGDLEVLKGVSLTVGQGELVSIVGSSGAGKSTLLQILGTLDTADKGEIVINNQRLQTLKNKELSRFRNKEIGFIFQFHHLLPEFTALENVCIPGHIAERDEQDVIESGEKLLVRLGLKDRLVHKPNELSGGEQQRVAVARALINRPAVIFADEPSGNLDSKNSKELHQLFFELKNEFNQTFIIVTHNNDLADLSDKKLVMRDGVIV